MNFFPNLNNDPVEETQGEKELESPAGEKKVEPIKKHFAVWDVKGNSIRLKLQTGGVKELEARYKTSIMNLMQNDNGIPPLTVMLDVVHTALKPWNHKITQKDTENLYDSYLEGGGDLMSFYTGVYLEIFMVSGFLSQKMASEMAASLEEMRREL